MNYELIIKLAKLANNNPNEHEANSAARKVCILLAEGGFKFGNSRSPFNPIPDYPKWESDPLTDLMNQQAEILRRHQQEQVNKYKQNEQKVPKKSCRNCKQELRNFLGIQWCDNKQCDLYTRAQ